jgi:5-methylcytosine-specific restriction endonuclease McrA
VSKSEARKKGVLYLLPDTTNGDKIYFMKLNELSNIELYKRILQTRDSERRLEVDFLLYLREVEKRDLHLEWGYSSLFTYLVNSLGYSEGGASRRVRVSRLIEEYPEMVEMLKTGSTNLTSLSYVAKVLSSDNSTEILSKIKSKPSREVEELAVTYKAPGNKIADCIKPVITAPKVVKDNTLDRGLFDQVLCEGSSSNNDIPTKSFCNRQESIFDFPVAPKVEYQLQCTLSPEVKSKLERAQALMAHKVQGNTSLENVLDVLLDSYLTTHGREERAERARERKNSQKKEKRKDKLSSKSSARRKHIPNEIKRKVFERDGYACSYVSRDGTSCKKTAGLEIDHILPVALGGDDSEGNLRVLCREHNQYFARKVFGAQLIERKIKQKV